MKKIHSVFVGLLVVVIFCACTPRSALPPVQLHISPGDHISQVDIAMDSAGFSHITGVVNDRVIYYRTLHGEPLVQLVMSMSGVGELWKQYDPKIAVTANQTAYIVWVEQRGLADKFGCWRALEFFPHEPYSTTCLLLDHEGNTTGHVGVFARGSKAFAVFDRKDNHSIYVDSLQFVELTNETNRGKVEDFIDLMEMTQLDSFDAAIDAAGKLHVAWIDDDATPGMGNHLRYASNVRVTGLGDMAQFWQILPADGYYPITKRGMSVALFGLSGEEAIAISAVVRRDSDMIEVALVSACETAGCPVAERHTDFALLPGGWDADSAMTEPRLGGTDDSLWLAYLADADETSGGYEEVYLVNMTAGTINQITSSGTYKGSLGLRMLRLREPYPSSTYPGYGWVEYSGNIRRFYSNVYINSPLMVHYLTCTGDAPRRGRIAVSGVEFSGVMEACGDAWFSVNTYNQQLPLIMR